jgi:DNA polymerase-3 subunit alpha
MYGLAAVRDIGDKAARDIIEERELNGSYESFASFTERNPAHALKAGMALIKAGAFDSIEDRGVLLATVEKSINKKKQEELEAEGLPLPRWTVAEHINHNRKLKTPREVPEAKIKPTKAMMREWEADMLGAKIGGVRPVDENKHILDQYVYTEEEFEDLRQDDEVVVAGEIIEYIQRTTKRGDPYAIINLAYGPERFSLKLWSEALNRYRPVIEEADGVIVFGQKDVWNDNESITVRKLADVTEFCAEHQEA